VLEEERWIETHLRKRIVAIARNATTRYFCHWLDSPNPIWAIPMTTLPSHIRAVFFDVVGTVLFPNPGAPIIYAEAARRGGLDLSITDVRVRFIQAYNIQEEIDRAAGWVTSEDREERRWRSIVAATLRGVSDPEACFSELYAHFANPTSWRVGDDIGHVIAALIERGIVVGLGSNYDSRLWSVLEGFPELASLRERTIISSVVEYRKPAVEFFQNVVRVADCEPSEVLFVGDDLANDYSGAIAAGLDARLLDESHRYSISNRIERLTDLIA
jgi:putative hydrolase of the HAD superfamily